MADLLTDDMDIRDSTLSMDVGGNGDYYLSLKETKRGKIIKIDTRIAMSGGNATAEVKTAIANLYKALQGEQVSSVLKANDNIPLVNNSALPKLPEFAAANFDNVAEIAQRLTTGNVSHHARTIEGLAKRNAEFIRKHYC